MRVVRSFEKKSLWLLLAAFGALQGCSAAAEPETNEAAVDSARSELAMGALSWAFNRFQKEVNTCFWQDGFSSTQQATYQRAKREAQFALERTWGAASNLRFTGGNDCPADSLVPAESVPIIIRFTSNNNDGGGVAVGVKGARFPSERLANGQWVRPQVVLKLTPILTEFWNDFGRATVHEMGHVLGFPHEQQRPDADRCPSTWHTNQACKTNRDCANILSGVCDLQVYSGNPELPGKCINGNNATVVDHLLPTPYDPYSVMNYCAPALGERLSFWDIYGIGRLYAPRTNAFRQLVSATKKGTEKVDWAGFATPASADRVLGPVNGTGDYELKYGEGWIFGYQAPETKPVELYYHAGRDDYALVASDYSRFILSSGGYERVGEEGYAYGTPQPGTLPLKSYWHPEKLDVFTTANAQLGDAALAYGYQSLQTEAYILPGTADNGRIGTMPYDVLQGFWSSLRKDYAVAVLGSARATELYTSGYERKAYDGIVLKPPPAGTAPLPGTAPLKQFFNPSHHDYFATATDVGAGSAAVTGYELRGTEGYVFTGGHTGAAPLNLWNHPIDKDAYTTVERPPAAGYVLVRPEGYAYPSNW